MGERRQANLVIGVLVIIGCAAVLARFQTRRLRVPAPHDTVWRLAYEITFVATEASARIRVAVPGDTTSCRLIRQALVHPSTRAVLMRNAETGETEVACSARKPGVFRLAAHYDLHRLVGAVVPTRPVPGRLSTSQRARYLRSEKRIQTTDPDVRAVAAELAARNAGVKEHLIDRVFSFCHGSLVVTDTGAPQDAAAVIRSRQASPPGAARAMVALCRAARVPARLVAGFELTEGEWSAPRVWVEVWRDKHWVPYDPANGYAGELPPDYLPVRRDAAALVLAKGDATRITSAFSLRRIRAPTGLGSVRRRTASDMLDLTRLPLSLRADLALLLLLPLGALLTAVLRNLVGVRTFGTFTPVLIALCFIDADWETGLLIFAAVLVLGIVGRVGLERLKLLMVPRLSLLLTLVVLAMVAGVSVMHHVDRVTGNRALLLPLVILTMMIERFTITAEEDGMVYSLRLLAQTALVAVCCFLVLSWRALGWVVLTYPEIHCFTLAALVWVGRYAGYRLTELWRFRELVQAPPAGQDGPR